MRLTFLVLHALFVLTCCNDGGEKPNETDSRSPRIPRKTSILSPSPNKLLTIGEAVAFKISSKKEIDSILFDDDHQKIIYETDSFTWQSTKALTGEKRFKITVYFNEGKSETHFPRVRFLSDVEPEKLTYKVIEKYPHDPEAYTQGLFFMDDVLYESTGRKGRSSIRKVNLHTGEKIKQVNIDSEYFGEGSTYWGDKIIMLTYRSNVGFVFDAELNQTGKFNYNHEGWGATTRGDTLIVSDGTEKLHLLDPRDYSEIGTLEVYDNKGPIKSLNELEIIDGLIYANIYTEDNIAVIDPNTGKVLKMIDLSGLLSNSEKSGLDEVNDVLNGIAYHKSSGKIYVTGKDWPSLFQVEFLKKEEAL
ncbi:MAG: glutaminyl-peptide cyclotransferase [Cyclobacteriaceae bacterium]